MLITGIKEYGRTDEVKEVMYTATLFQHLWFIPVRPIQSQLFLKRDSGVWNPVMIPLSRKSMTLGYSRALSIAACIVLTLAAITFSDLGSPAEWITLAVLAAGCALLFLYLNLAHPCRFAHHERALQIARAARLNDEVIARINDRVGHEQRLPFDDLG